MSNFLDDIRKLSAKQLMLLAYDQHERLEARAVPEPIAIIGIGCRLPGAHGHEAFWRLLAEGRDAIGEIPAVRWNNADLFDPDPDAAGRIPVRAGGFIADVDAFDAGFFGIAPREAQSMDPQQRLCLEVAWDALEDAGLPPDRLANTATGVFVGQSSADYLQRLLKQGDAAIDGYLAAGNSPAVTSGRLAYCLGLRGPALTVDTSCSSSLVALHLACRSLRSGETQVALAGGVNLICAPELTMALSRAHMLAPDGRSKAFDAGADGFGRGEGCGVLVLKRLSDAQVDGDLIHAVIRGSAANQDGRSAGLTVPNGPSQEAVIAAALENANVAPGDVTYVEAHGTGTALGDPIEARALSRAFGAGRPETAKLLVGSVKTNIGHLEAAAGVAGIIKTALCLSHGRVAPSLHYRTSSPHIPWEDLCISVATAEQAWPAGRPRIAGVSSFGFSGTNAHIVMEAAPAPDAAPPAAPLPVHCLPLSARHPAALGALSLRYADLLATGASLADVAREAGRGRTHHPLRLAVVADEAPVAVAALRAFAAGQAHRALLTKTAAGPRAASGQAMFLFAGSAPIDARVGQALYDRAAAFRDLIDRAAAVLGSGPSGKTLTEMVRGGTPLPQDHGWTRAAALALQCAMAALWAKLGMSPRAAIGQGLGEIAAAIVSGSVDLADGLRAAIATAPAAGGGGETSIEAILRPHASDCAVVLGIGSDADALARAAAAVPPGTLVLAGYPASDDPTALMRSLGTLYVNGVPIAWQAIGGQRAAIRLPTYPFERQRYWVDLAPPPAIASVAGVGWPGTRLPTALPIFETMLHPQQPGLVTISVDNRPTVAEAKLVELALWGMRAAYGTADWTAEGLSVRHELTLPPSGLRAQLHLGSDDDGPVSFAIYSQTAEDAGGWMLHLKGLLAPSGLDRAAGGGSAESAGQLEPFVRDTIARTLLLRGPAEVPLEAELFELGMDSLMAMQVRGTLASRLGVEVPLLQLLLPGLTVGGLIDLILAAPPSETLIAEAAESLDWEDGVL